jgi:hypothetical protein
MDFERQLVTDEGHGQVINSKPVKQIKKKKK